MNDDFICLHCGSESYKECELCGDLICNECEESDYCFWCSVDYECDWIESNLMGD